MKTILAILALTATISLFPSCSTVGYKKADDTSTALQAAAQSIDQALAPMDNVLATLSDLLDNPGENITTQFQSYSAAVSDLQASIEAVRSHNEDARAEGVAYFEKWESELTTIQSNDIQARSRDRKDAVSKQFAEATDRYDRTLEELAPFLSNLVDIRTLLANDLTAGGLDSVTGLLRKARNSASTIRTSMIGLSDEYKDLSAALAPNASFAQGPSK